MNDLNIDYINDILSTSVISHKNLIGETLFVNSNPAKVESVEIKKVNNVIVTSRKINDYKLDSTTTEIINLDKSTLMFSISLLLDNKFIKSLEIFDTDELEFYKKGVMKLFSKPNPQLIVDEVGEYYDWIITSPKIFNYLSKHKNFESIKDDKVTSIKLRGKINHLSLFVTDNIDSDTLFKGSCKDSSSVMLDRLDISKDNIYVKVDYLFINRGVIKLILI
jgi:transglutaminase-like putative cysteine protease